MLLVVKAVMEYRSPWKVAVFFRSNVLADGEGRDRAGRILHPIGSHVSQDIPSQVSMSLGGLGDAAHTSMGKQAQHQGSGGVGMGRPLVGLQLHGVQKLITGGLVELLFLEKLLGQSLGSWDCFGMSHVSRSMLA